MAVVPFSSMAVEGLSLKTYIMPGVPGFGWEIGKGRVSGRACGTAALFFFFFFFFFLTMEPPACLHTIAERTDEENEEGGGQHCPLNLLFYPLGRQGVASQNEVQRHWDARHVLLVGEKDRASVN